jgi:ATP-binding protein involved in chromosome partitioning
MASHDAPLEQAVAGVVEPELGLPLGAVAMVRSTLVRRHRAEVVLALPTATWPGQGELVGLVRARASEVPGVAEVTVETAVMDDVERGALRRRLRADMGGDDHDHDHDHDHGAASTPAFLRAGSATRVIGISSGKGGVGKSSVAVNLAVALALSGRRVGILDADVYGFSVPKMLGAERPPVVLGDLVLPATAYGVQCLSMGFFVPDDQPVIWRGPMLHKAIEQFLSDAYWGTPDFLIVDMPPGTGDVALSLAQVMPRAEIVVVTTPQPAAQRVAQRSAFAARKLKLAVRGVIENMSWFTGDDGTRYELFGAGGGAQLAQELAVPLLGTVPLVPAVRQGGDEGRPVVAAEPDSEAARAFTALAVRLAALGPARVYRRELAIG